MPVSSMARRQKLENYQSRVRQRVAENLRSVRQSLGLTQERAAELVGFSLQYLQRIERQVVNVPLDTLARFAHAYKVDVLDLLADSTS